MGEGLFESSARAISGGTTPWRRIVRRGSWQSLGEAWSKSTRPPRRVWNPRPPSGADGSLCDRNERPEIGVIDHLDGFSGFWTVSEQSAVDYPLLRPKRDFLWDFSKPPALDAGCSRGFPLGGRKICMGKDGIPGAPSWAEICRTDPEKADFILRSSAESFFGSPIPQWISIRVASLAMMILETAGLDL